MHFLSTFKQLNKSIHLIEAKMVKLGYGGLFLAN